MKFLHVKFSDATYRIPVEVIARDRARNLADSDFPNGGDEWHKIFNEELLITLEDDDELIDWASNNIDWEDVSGYAEKVEKPIPQPDYRKEWTNAKKSVRGK